MGARRAGARPRPASRPLRLLLGGVIGGGVVLLTAAAAELPRPAPPAWRLLLGVTLAVLGNAPLLRLRFGAHGSSFNYGEAAVMLLLPLLPPAWLIVVTAAGVLLTQVAGRSPPLKAAFNVGSFVLAFAVALGVVRLLAPVAPSGPLTGAQVGALIAGVVVFSVLENAAVLGVVALSERLPYGEVVRRALGVQALVALGNLAAGLGVLVLARWDWRALVPLPALLLTASGTYRGYLAAAESRDTWQRLERAGTELNQLDEDSLADAVLHHAVELFLADWVELALEPSGGLPARCYRRDSRTPDGARPQPSPDQGSTTIVPLRHRNTDLGALHVGFHPRVRLSEREGQVLANFARTVSAAVANARLYGELRVEAERRAFEATHDPLTGLANRRLLLGAAGEAAARRPRDRVCALLLLDLDHFKQINEALGHAIGDALLLKLADRLVEVVGPDGVVGRLAGDEFAVLLPAAAETDVPEVAAELQQTLAEPAAVRGVRLSIEASAGAACLPGDAHTPEELLQRAGVALALAKKSPGSFRRYRAEDDVTSLQRLELAAELRGALADEELVVHFQPQLDLATGEVVGVEALSRWRHPQRGLLRPADYIDVVESSGLVRPFTLHVLDAVVAQAARWAEHGVRPHVSVNLSARTLLDRQLPDDVAHILRRHGVPAERIVLEITETTMMSELEIVEGVLARLRAVGVELSVDDFGTGYSSLALLQRVAVNEVKVDKSFVLGMTRSESDRAIVRATVELAHSLGLRVVAEGVETVELLTALRRLGCDRAQGYHVGRPVPPDQLEGVMRRPASGLRLATVPARRPGAASAR